MTREDKIKAFTMRINGMSWYRIAKEMGLSPDSVQRSVVEAIRVKHGESLTKKRGTIVYPSIADYLCKNHMCIRDLARKMGQSFGPHVYNVLYGMTKPRPYTIACISEATGIPAKQLLKERDEYYDAHA
jgi:transcriptional regulator with XRE-family HTH domain